MRLKVSPKAAVQVIDTLVKEGVQMREQLGILYEKLDKDVEIEHEEKVTAREEERQNARKTAENQPDNIELAMPDGSKVSMPNPAKQLASIAVLDALMPSISSVPSFLGGDGFESEIEEKRMEELRQQFADWRDRTTKGLEDIFMDFTPVHTFMDAVGEFYSQSFPFRERHTQDYINITRHLDAKVEVLIGFYKALSENVRSPLIYLPDQAKVCFYDFICPLKTDSNEASLCTFIFQHSIGEKVEMIDAYNHMFGEERTTLGVTEKDKIKNAADGINRKTNKIFGFPIIAKDTTTISLTIPARVTQNLL